jgi:hypothetical protein
MATVKAEFDGRVFVPSAPVSLPAGTNVEVILPSLPRKLTSEELRGWQEIEKHIAASQPVFPNVDEAMQYTRKRP